MDLSEESRRRRAADVVAAFPEAWKASKSREGTGTNWTANLMANSLGYVPELGLGRKAEGQTTIVRPPPNFVIRQPDMDYDTRVASDVMQSVGRGTICESSLGSINYSGGISFQSGGLFSGVPSPDWRQLKKEEKRKDRASGSYKKVRKDVCKKDGQGGEKTKWSGVYCGFRSTNSSVFLWQSEQTVNRNNVISYNW